MHFHTMKTFLNVGGGKRETVLPRYLIDWKQVLLDLDPAVEPDICKDARQLTDLPAAAYDAVYCCHTLEHFYQHDVVKVVRGFLHVLKPDGFAQVIVPDLGGALRHVAQRNLDIDDVLGQSAIGPIHVRDIIYGYQVEIAQSGQDYYAHKNGFTSKSLVRLFQENGFRHGSLRTGVLELQAFFFSQAPSADLLAYLKIPSPTGASQPDPR
jgi:hypothetical protein